MLYSVYRISGSNYWGEVALFPSPAQLYVTCNTEFCFFVHVRGEGGVGTMQDTVGGGACNVLSQLSVFMT